MVRPLINALIVTHIILTKYLNELESPLKRRAQDDLWERPRKFSNCYPFQLHTRQPFQVHTRQPFQIHTRQPHLSLFTIHRSNSFHDDLVNGLPTVADRPRLSTTGLLSPTADKENIDPTPFVRPYNKAVRRPQRKPLQEHADIEGKVGNEDSNAFTSREC